MTPPPWPPTPAPWRAWSATWNGWRNWNRPALWCAKAGSANRTRAPAMPWNAASIASLPLQPRRSIVDGLDEVEIDFLLRDWNFWARPSQLPPDGDWRIWLFLGGRGAGKTRAGAEWIAGRVRDGTA